MPRILAKTLDMPREEWLKLRRTGIGGSDAGTICGLNPYSSLLELWADKTGRLPEKEETEAMRTGRDQEGYVADRFCEAAGKEVRCYDSMFQHDKYDFITANIDREVVGENAGLECKVTSVLNRSDFENGEIPQQFYCQCMHYMNVMGYEKMYLAIWIPGVNFHWFTIPYNESEGAALLKQEREFWEQYIIPDIRPEPDGSDSAKAALNAVFKERDMDTVTLFDAEENAAELVKIKAQIKALEAEEKRLTNQFISALENHSRAVTFNYEMSYLKRLRTSADSKKLKAEFPDVYEKVKKETAYNVFDIKERKVNI